MQRNIFCIVAEKFNAKGAQRFSTLLISTKCIAQHKIKMKDGQCATAENVNIFALSQAKMNTASAHLMKYQYLPQIYLPQNLVFIFHPSKLQNLLSYFEIYLYGIHFHTDYLHSRIYTLHTRPKQLSRTIYRILLRRQLPSDKSLFELKHREIFLHKRENPLRKYFIYAKILDISERRRGIAFIRSTVFLL